MRACKRLRVRVCVCVLGRAVRACVFVCVCVRARARVRVSGPSRERPRRSSPEYAQDNPPTSPPLTTAPQLPGPGPRPAPAAAGSAARGPRVCVRTAARRDVTAMRLRYDRDAAGT